MVGQQTSQQKKTIVIRNVRKVAKDEEATERRF